MSNTAPISSSVAAAEAAAARALREQLERRRAESALFGALEGEDGAPAGHINATPSRPLQQTLQAQVIGVVDPTGCSEGWLQGRPTSENGFQARGCARQSRSFLEAPEQHVIGVVDETACCEGWLLGQPHSADCPRLLAQALAGLERLTHDQQIAYVLQAAELQEAREQNAALQAVQQHLHKEADRFVFWEPLWGEIVFPSDKAPGCLKHALLNCCPCAFVSCRTGWGRRAWRKFLLSFSTLFAVAQALAVMATLIIGNGFVSLKENPMLGPAYVVLNGAGAKNAARILLLHEWWRLFSAVMLHAGLFHLVGNLIVQLRSGAMLEAMFGKKAWLLIYVCSGGFSMLSSCVAYPNRLGVGSSGALCGLIGAWLCFIIITWNQTLPSDVKMRNAQTVSISISVVVIIATSFLPLMDFAAHLGGLAIGIGLAMTLFAGRLQHGGYRYATRAAGVCLVAALLILMIILVLRTQPSQALLQLCGSTRCT